MFYIVVGFIILFVLVKYVIVPLRPTHGGGVVYRTTGTTREFLLVTSSKDVRRWVLPKGHIEKGETEQQAALREVAEEAGIQASIVIKIGNVKQLKSLFAPINTAFFLMQYESETTTSENRKMVWHTLDEAIMKATLAAHKRVLQQVRNRLEEVVSCR